jgi:hypothetical protein
MRLAPAPRVNVVRLPDEAVVAMRRYTYADYMQLMRQPYPQPPFPGNENIVPITSHVDLAKEGAEQGHCAGIYLAPVQAGLSYVYKVLKPERATLSLSRHGGAWQLKQVRGRANAAVSSETMRAVRAWLAEVQNR